MNVVRIVALLVCPAALADPAADMPGRWPSTMPVHMPEGRRSGM